MLPTCHMRVVSIQGERYNKENVTAQGAQQNGKQHSPHERSQMSHGPAHGPFVRPDISTRAILKATHRCSIDFELHHHTFDNNPLL
jgi:hypothetical protein